MPKILIVEDNDEIAAYLRDMLQTAGYDADRAATGDGAVLRAMNNAYDMVLMDLVLGNAPNGALVTLALRGVGFSGPVVVLTGNLAGIDEEIMEAAGFAGQLLKPALPKDVLPEVARQLGVVSKVLPS